MIAFIFALLLSSAAWADSGLMLAGVANRQLPLDAISTPTGAYGLQRLRTAYATNKLIRLRRASDSTEVDIGFTAPGDIDLTAANTHCNATTCFVVTWYDQSGGARDITQATAGNQPSFIFTCLGTRPCVRVDTGTAALTAAGNVTPATGTMSLAAAANRSVGTGGVTISKETGGANSNRFQFAAGTANAWQLVANGSITFNATASDNVWHAGTTTMNGASSAITIDATNTTGTATGSVIAGAPGIGTGIAGTTVSQILSVFWDNVALTTGQRLYVNNGIRAWWGF